jgi:geranyl-CoA carboxylase alpha subunit
MKPFRTILVANRGEIAVRVIRTARRLGYRTVAVYSEADALMPHVESADSAVCIGPAPAAQSYLSIERIVEAARLTKADAIHPGYGFLSENDAFAEACAASGITFIGPPAEAIRLMGDKALAKRIMTKAEVPCIPGYQQEDQSVERLTLEAQRIGYPIMVKATAGGGGKGIRMVNREAELAQALQLSRSEAQKSFGDGSLMLEKALIAPRHVEVQVFADTFGCAVHIGDRDCSIQRRHQKVIEEAPAPGLSLQLRKEMADAAVKAVKAVDYVGAGTIEFLVDLEERFYFLEMNTRLQVEHAVTEMVTGLDLVEWQVRVANGEPLPLAQDKIAIIGHAVEARVYAEDPVAGFLPQSGTLRTWRPSSGPGVRVDHGLNQGAVVSTFYDPMLAKVIGYGGDRNEATRRLVRALEDFVISGVPTNRTFLLDCLTSTAFVDAHLNTSFIERNISIRSKSDKPPETFVALAAVMLHEHAARKQPDSLRNWRSSGRTVLPFSVRIGEHRHIAQLSIDGNSYRANVGPLTAHVRILNTGEAASRIEFDGVAQLVHSAWFADELTLHFDGADFVCSVWHENGESNDGGGNTVARSPMPGVVVSLSAKEGDLVTKGDVLLIMEAMKMETPILAPASGTIVAVRCTVGQQVPLKHVLIEIEPTAI